ncbi:hypothetical protein CKN80_04985 [Carnobacterium divergens]|uniref:immunoglobulin-like domain-containing protein n=1 Tax=Carnobacterium divergens TaxID=2748 RepID=UPI0010722986|nr:immunoglobulin-like domain-containing protein [Carnobacterium divergens]TFJ46185.1 hypothetical protein CKN79_04980 [Carnobacterium divergens]TFJ52523.1 hypothetical protein CKN80_04985 [Carnobacterium divergens]
MKKNVKKSVVSLVSFVSVAGVLSGSIIPVSAAAETLNKIAPVTSVEEKSSEVENKEAVVDDSQETTVDTAVVEQPQNSEVQVNPESKSGESADLTRASADKNITTLMLKVRNTNINKKTQFAYTPGVNVNNPYQAGELTGYARVPLQGNVLNRSILPTNGIEHIKNWEQGNYGARINVTFPAGVDARAMFNTINWEKSNQSTNSDFYIKAIGIPTPVHLTWGLKWDRDTVMFNSAASNEFSIMLKGINKAEVSDAEWNKYNPLVTASALGLVGAIPGGGFLGNMDGWAEGTLSFDMAKYTGNTDDITKDKELTKGRLFPDKTRNSKYTINVLDQNALMAGTEGTDNIAKSLVKPGHEHDNPQISNEVPTWDSYLSIWDNEKIYNTNNLEENEVVGENGALPGDSLFNRDLIVNKGEDFNKFNANRFNRVINYFTKEDVTKGSVGDVNSVSISHLPGKVPENIKTPVTYTGSVSYYNGDTRQLIPNVLNVTNNSKPATEGTIKANDFTIGDANITGTYTGDVARLRLYINGVSVAWGGMLENGKFTFYAANQHISANDVVTMNAYDKDDNLLQENAPVKVNNATVAGSISPAEYSIGDTEITGSYTGDVAKARVTINGKAQAWGGSFTNGHFSYYVGAGKIKAGDKVTITAYDKNDKVLDANKPVKIKANATQGTITPANFSLDDMNITGTYTGDVAKARVTINGKAQAWGGSFTNGRFSYYVGANKIKSGDNVTITAYDRDDKVLDQNKKVTINEVSKGSITPSTYHIGETTIKGTYTGNIVRARAFINGTPQAWGGSFNGGSFSYYIGAGKIKAGDVVTIIGYSADNSEIDTQKINVQS